MDTKIKFASDNKVNALSYKVIKDLYGIEGAFLTNLSSLYDFEETLDEIPGHKLTRFTEIPETDRKLYDDKCLAESYNKREPDLVKLDRLWVWYPPLTKEVEKKLSEAYRRTIIKKLEKTYGISFKTYPNDHLYIWEVAKFI